MKKLFSIIMVVIMVTCLAACGNNTKGSNDITDTTITTITPEEIEEVPELPKLSKNFIETALQFIDEYPTPSKELENLAAEVIRLSDGYSDELYSYLTPYVLEKNGEVMKYFFGDHDKIYTVSVYIYNGTYGGYSGGMIINNGQDYLHNYSHDKIILACGVLGEHYLDNIALAQARIAAYALTYMYQDEACSTIKCNSEGEFYYDFTFENETFKTLVKDTLEFLYKF